MAKKRCLPSLAKWSTFGPGTACPDYVRGRRINGFSYHGSKFGNYAVEPSCPTGRVQGYYARFENVKGTAKLPGLHQMIGPDGQPGYAGARRSVLFRSAAQAATAANKHCTLVDQGLAGVRRRRRSK